MLDERFVIVGVAINFIGALSYLIDTIKGRIKPNRITWFLWALAPLIAFTAEIKQGVGLQSLMTFAVGFNPLLIFLASFVNKKAEWKLRPFDFFCGGLSVIGLLLWYITKIGNIAILFSIFADGTAALPTIKKSYQMPETENYKGFFCAAINASITILTIKIWNFAHYGFPLYILLINTLLFVLIRFRLGKLLKSRLQSCR